MKATLIIATLLTITTIVACTKESDLVGEPSSQALNSGTSPKGISGLVAGRARLSSDNCSQSISLDTANRMLASYLNSVGYPAVDTAIRSFSFDADTLRAYLENKNIVTLKFMVAHKPEYANSEKYGKFAGMKPEALTFVIVGMDNDENNVLNGRGGVYDHLVGCPLNCPGGVNSPYLY